MRFLRGTRAVFSCALFLVCVALLASCFATPVSADTITVQLVETGKITSYFDEYWVVNVDGNVTISNPSARDLYSVGIRYDLGSLNLVELGGTNYFQGTSMVVPHVPANSSVTVPYNIVGISLVDPTLVGKGVLYSAMTKFAPIIYSDTFGSLQKASLEDANYTGRPGRLVSVQLNNPTGFQFTVNSMRVLKTPTLDPNTILAEWKLVNDTDPITISPDALFVRDILDLNSADGQVYWLVADMFISHVNFVDLSNITRYTQRNLTIPPELLNYTTNESNETNRSLLQSPVIYVKKIADRQVVTTAEPVSISLLINNFAQQLETVTITDKLPPGFLFLGGDGWSENAGVLTYRGAVSGRGVLVPHYSAILNDSESAGFDFFDAAKVQYTDQEQSQIVYSDTVPFIRQFLPEKKIYVQKKLQYLDGDKVAVSISVQNLGGADVSNLLLKEYLQDGDLFSQITQQPDDKGLWKIDRIGAGQTWDVTYTTTKDSQINFLPGLYGVPAGNVIKSLVSENVISSAWQRVGTPMLEGIGIVLLIGLPIVYFFIKKKTGSA